MKLLLALVLVAAAAKIVYTQKTGGCGVATDFIFLVDSSGSVVDQPLRSNNWSFVLRFLYNVVLNLGRTLDSQYESASSGLRFAFVQYAGNASITFGLNTISDYNEVADAMTKAVPLFSGNDMLNGIRTAERLMTKKDQNNIRNTVLVIVSDWQQSVTGQVISEARRLEQQYNVQIVVVGIFGYSNTNQLAQVATNRENAIFSEDHQRLSTYISKLITVLCESPNGSPSQPASGNCLRDMVFALDASYSISNDGWSRLKNFAATLAGNMFNLDPNTRVGVVTFSTNAAISSPLGPYTSDLANLIENINHPQQLTNHAAALRKASEMLPDSQRIRWIIIVTDGIPTEEIGTETELANQLRAQGINILTIAVGQSIDRGTLERLVGDANKDRYIFWSPNYDVGIMSQLNQITAVASCPAREPLPTPPPVCIDRPAEIVILIDSSGSIVEKGADNWTLMKGFAIDLIRNILFQRPGSRMATVLFSDNAPIVESLTGDSALLERELRGRTHLNGYTNQGAAFEQAEIILRSARPNSYQYIIMVTDGEANINNGTEIVVANRLKSRGVSIIMIGVTMQIARQNLLQLATSPSYVFEVPTFASLNAQITPVIQSTTFCPQSTARPPAPTTPPPVCFAADIVFAIDNSGSIPEKGRNNPQLLKDFVVATARLIASRYPLVKFGLVVFSDDARVVLSLKNYKSFDQFVQAVQSVNDIGAQTNIAAALRVSRLDIQAGATNSPQIVLVTDGIPTAERGVELTEAQITAQMRIDLIAVGVTYDVDRQLLVQLTGSENRVFVTANFQTLQSEIVKVAQIACGQGGSAIGPTAEPRCEGEPDIVFILDASGSITEINGSNWYSALQLISEAIQHFSARNAKSQFGLVIFSTVARIEYRLSGDVNTLLQRLREGSIRYDQDRTNIPDGLEKARDVFGQARQDSDRIAILITDGRTNERVNQEEYEATLLKRMGVSIVPVGITEAPDFNLLARIGDTEVIRTPNFQVLRNQLDKLIRIVCDGGNGNNGNGNNGNGNNGNGQNTAFPILNPGPQCTSAYVVLALDVSSRLNQAGLPYGGIDSLITLVNQLIQDITARFGRTQFALITFDQTARIIRDFPDYRGVPEFQAYLNILEPVKSVESNIAAALRATWSIVNQPQIQNAQVFVFTDGIATFDSGIQNGIAGRLRLINTKVMAVALTPQAQISILEEMTSARELVFNAQAYQYTNRRALTEQVTPDCSNAIVSLQVDSVVCSSDVVFIVDSSGDSYNPNNWLRLKSFLVAVVEEYARTNGIRVRFGIIDFSETARIVMPLSSNLAKVRFEIENMRHRGGRANFAAGLAAAYGVFDTMKVRKIAMFLTDGNTEMKFWETFNEADRLNGRDIDVVPIRITDKPKSDFLARLAGDDIRRVISVPDHDRLLNDVQSIIKVGCGNYYKDENTVFEDEQAKPPREGGNPERPQVAPTPPTLAPATPAPATLSTTTPTSTRVPQTSTVVYGTTKPPPSALDCNILDLTLIVDSSSEIQLNPSLPGSGTTNWDLVREMLQSLTDSFRVTRYNVKVGLVQYARDPKVTFDFKKYETSRRLKDALSRIDLMGAGKNLADTFKFTKDQLFTGLDRSNVANLAIVIMEGVPNYQVVHTEYEATELKRQSRVFIVGIQRGLDNVQIAQQRSYATPGYYLGVNDFKDLNDAIPKITQMICGQPSRADP